MKQPFAQAIKKGLAKSKTFTKFVAPIGLEPIQTEPESAVLPLHHKAIELSSQK